MFSCAWVLTALPLKAQKVFGFRNFSQQGKWDTAFLAVPDAKLAGEHMQFLTAAPHWASSPEDYTTALYVADRFQAAGLRTEIVPYRVRLTKPVSIHIEAFDGNGKNILTGPSPEHVDGGTHFQDDARVLPIFNGSSPSGNVTGEVVYANYGTEDDFKRLADLGISVRDRIVLVRYGRNFRGTKVYLAQQNGARGILIYSDPADDGSTQGTVYPHGPYRPASSAERGSVEFLPIYPGDPDTPGFASTLSLPDSVRLSRNEEPNEPRIPANPLSAEDAQPILEALGGAEAPTDWQGGLPFTYHMGPGKVTVHMRLVEDSSLRTIWDVIGTIPGTVEKNEWVIAGNHRDAWVYGAADPASGTAAMLEAVHGLGELLRHGWRPRRTIMLASWDAEEEGLIGSTEWVEQRGSSLSHAVAYFNTDIAVSGPYFNAAAVPSLKPFLIDIAQRVASPRGGTVYDRWAEDERAESSSQTTNSDVEPGNLGSGSDYTPFLQHAGVPSTDIGSSGAYGVYHSVFDNENWFVKFGDPGFVYVQQQARIFGLEILHMADADVLPYDYGYYGQEILHALRVTEDQARQQNLKLDFTAAERATEQFTRAGVAIHALQERVPQNPTPLNLTLRSVELALLNPVGLPQRPWYKHTIVAPGLYTGYAAVMLPGVHEAIREHDASGAQAQLGALTDALYRAAHLLEAAAPISQPGLASGPGSPRPAAPSPETPRS